MNEIEFRLWMSKKEVKKKVQSDIISRLRRIEREFHQCDIDEQYHIDECKYIMSLFENKGINEAIKAYPNIKLPIGKYQLSTYKHALKKYIEFLNSEDKK